MPAMTPTGTPTSQTRRSSSFRRMPTVRRPRMAPEHADGGEAVLLRLVALIAEACFGAGLRASSAACRAPARDSASVMRSRPLWSVSAGPQACCACCASRRTSCRARRSRSNSMVIPPCSFCFQRPGRCPHTASAKAVQAARQAERVPVSRARQSSFRWAGVKFRKLDACGLQGGVQPQQGRDGGAMIGQRLPCGDVGRGTGMSRVRGAVGKVENAAFRLRKRGPSCRKARRGGKAAAGVGGRRPGEQADDLARQGRGRVPLPRHRGCGRRRRRSRPSSPRPARGR